MSKHKITCSNGVYTLTQSNGVTIELKTFYETTKDKWHVVIPQTSKNITGREYFTKSMVDKNIKAIGEHVFETRTTPPRVGLSWRARLTKEEEKQLSEAEATIAKLKELAGKRVPPTVSQLQAKEAEYLAKIAELEAKLKAKNK